MEIINTHKTRMLSAKRVTISVCIVKSKISATNHGDVEHIKPKDKFPELEFEWGNLGYACQKCNNAKSNKHNEKTPLINPYDENPSDHLIAFGFMLWQKQGSERGQKTILNIDLNRLSLVQKRKERIDDVEKAMNDCFRTADEELKKNSLVALKITQAKIRNTLYLLSLFCK